MNPYDEESYEKSVIQIFENLGYGSLYGPDISRDYNNPIYMEQLVSSLNKINPNSEDNLINSAVNQLFSIEHGSLEHKNSIFTDYLQNGMPVNFLNTKGEEETRLVKLVDFENIELNDFKVINQWTVVDNSEKRPDIVVFVNGLPLVVIELKSPSREEVDVSNAYRQLKTYMKEIPSLFVFNAFCIMSDQAISKAGTITANEDRFMEWKTVDGDYKSTKFADFTVLFNGMFEKNRFLDILENFILFSKGPIKTVKILAAYHQYFAVNKALKTTQEAVEGDGKAGVFWHTQGSGKSLSMVFYVNKLQNLMNSPTFVVITDRNDLDNQLFNQFTKCSDFLHQSPKQAASQKDLQSLLDDRKANGIFFTTIQKFPETKESLSNRHDIIVISDEAHRSQFGLDEKYDPVTGKIIIGHARRVRLNLPKATYIGFTGTPIAQEDKSTREVFGNYIDIYDMTQSVEDGATVPIHYESRVINIELDEKTLKLIDKEYEQLSIEAEPYFVEKSKKELTRMEELLGAPETIDSLCNDIINHYENNRSFVAADKAMIVGFSRHIGMKIYKHLLKLRPDWENKVNIVMTTNNNDPEDWHDIIGSKAHKDELARKFKDENDEFKIAIVVDMWLTGFDVPSLSTMYVFKPMRGHTLMQAIARVNRVYEGKNGGLIVDYIGLSSALKKAMSNYTHRDIDNRPMDISKKAYPTFKEKLEVCRDQLFGLDYSNFMSDDNLERAELISEGANFLLAPKKEDNKKIFIHEGLRLKKALSLCRSIVPTEERFEAAYFEAVRTLLTRLNTKGPSIHQINERISELLKHSIKSKGVINLFSTKTEEISLFDEDFLDRISKIDEKNLAINLLEKLINEKIIDFKTKNGGNVVQSEKFSDMLNKVMEQYWKGMLTSEKVIHKLLDMAKDMKNAHNEGEKLGLTGEELAFYDAITRPEAIKDFYTNEELIKITRELTNGLREKRVIDWQQKEAARAAMRVMVKHLLKKYDYPPKGMECAVDTVLKQCELWADTQT